MYVVFDENEGPGGQSLFFWICRLDPVCRLMYALRPFPLVSGAGTAQPGRCMGFPTRYIVVLSSSKAFFLFSFQLVLVCTERASLLELGTQNFMLIFTVITTLEMPG